MKIQFVRNSARKSRQKVLEVMKMRKFMNNIEYVLKL